MTVSLSEAMQVAGGVFTKEFPYEPEEFCYAGGKYRFLKKEPVKLTVTDWGDPLTGTAKWRIPFTMLQDAGCSGACLADHTLLQDLAETSYLAVKEPTRPRALDLLLSSIVLSL